MIIVLAGLAGSGKTALLAALATRHEQVLDLEALANHRGSAFGGLGLPPQPRHADFQASVRAALAAADPGRPLWVEDEGDYLGSVGLPPELVYALRVAPCVEVSCERADRIGRIVAGYGHHPIADWLAALRRIEPRLGATRSASVRRSLGDGDLTAAVAVLLDYYDRGYRHRTAAWRRPVLGSAAPSDVGAALALAGSPA